MPNIINTVIPLFRRGSRKKVSKMSHEMIMGWCRKWSSNVSCSRRTWPADNQNSCVALSLKLQWGQKVYADTLRQSQLERNVVFHFQQWILYLVTSEWFFIKSLLEGVPRYTNTPIVRTGVTWSNKGNCSKCSFLNQEHKGREPHATHATNETKR